MIQGHPKALDYPIEADGPASSVFISFISRFFSRLVMGPPLYLLGSRSLTLLFLCSVMMLFLFLILFLRSAYILDRVSCFYHAVFEFLFY